MRALLILLLTCLPWGAPQAACRQALVLALDVSSSVDPDEYRLQMQGLAGVLQDPDVQGVLLADPSAPVMLAVFEWAGRTDQKLVVPWIRLKSRTDLDRVSALLSTLRRGGGTRPTALGHALAYAGRLMEEVPDCWQKVVDVSGDGKNNDGFRPKAGKRGRVFDQITVNGLVIGKAFESNHQIAGNEIAALIAYYHQEVLHGPDAFLETALGFRDFARAMKKKILRETSIAVAQQSPRQQVLAANTP